MVDFVCYVFCVVSKSAVDIHFFPPKTQSNKKIDVLILGNQEKIRKLQCHLRLVWNYWVFFPFVDILDSRFCPFSLLFAAFWTWKLLLPRYLQHFGLQTFIHSFCIIFMESATFWRWKLSFQQFWFLHDCSTVFIDLSTVFVDFYMVFIVFWEVLIDFWEYTMCKLQVVGV